MCEVQESFLARFNEDKFIFQNLDISVKQAITLFYVVVKNWLKASLVLYTRDPKRFKEK